MSDRKAPAREDRSRDQLRDLERRLTALETRRLRFGAYWIEQQGGNLVARHATTGHITVLATPS